MIINTEQLPDWAIYVMIGGGVLLFLLVIWAITITPWLGNFLSP